MGRRRVGGRWPAACQLTAGEHLLAVRRSPNVTAFYRYGWCYADPYACRHSLHATTNDQAAMGKTHRCVGDCRPAGGGRARGDRLGRPRQAGPDQYDDHHDGPQGGPDQARVADHPGEQVLRRDVHRAQPEQLSLEDAAGAGCAAEELLRHRPLQPGQLREPGVRPGDAAGHPVRLQRRRHRLRQHREHRHLRPEQGPGARPSPAPTRPTARTAAPTRTPCPTLFNQLDSAKKSWKGYGQDIGNQPGREDARLRRTWYGGQRPDHQPDGHDGLGDQPVPARRGQLHRRPGQRPVRRQALPVPVVPQPDRRQERRTAPPPRR